ncbi:MAG TPA: hypothetical protein VG406_26945 [Isosphaeraceae bacterium]|jgi:hypothetical protein|nr:hypothetical protein [Isosphaeraceae bacterium]
MDDLTDVPQSQKAPTHPNRRGLLLASLIALLAGLGGLYFVEYRMGWFDKDSMQRRKGALPHLDKGSVGGNPPGTGRRGNAGARPKAEETVKE